MTREPAAPREAATPEDASEDWDEGEADTPADLDDDDEDEEEGAKRGWPLGALLGVAAGVWVGRWFYRLPDGLENLAGLVLVVATALLAAGLYRRWVRRQFVAARRRRR